MKKINYLLMTAAVMTTACSNIELEEFVPNSMKNQITFSGESNTSSRAGLHQSAPTQVIMHIKSEGPAENAVRVTRTQANATKDEKQSATSYSSVVFDDSYKRYWDDAYGRDAKLSVYAFAVPGKTSTDDTQVKEDLLAAPENDKTWSNTDLAHTVAWNVSTTQTEESILNEDLIYSNNISGDNKLKFNLEDPKDTDGPGKFEQGNLQFKHALARITINLNKGKGFEGSNFKFTGANNVTLYNIPTSATLNLTDGTWSNATSTSIKGIYEKTTSTDIKHELMAQVIPGAKYTKGSNDNAMSFIIGDNQYFITSDMMYDALNKAVNKAQMTKLTNTDVTLENGLNYIFNINVNKTPVITTATVEGWTDIIADITDPSNARITLNLLNNGTESNDVKFYRSAITTTDFTDPNNTKWETGYEAKGDAAWYFENNMTYYHFRAVNTSADVKTDATNGDYYPISAGTNDYLWGAPIKKSNATPDYNVTKGYADAINPAIGATTDAINMTQFHMMSQITIELTSTADKEIEKVDLTGSEVTITRIDNNGKVLMGSGLITLSGDTTSVKLNKAKDSYTYTLYVVPQLLERVSGSTKDDDYIGISIKTANGQSMYYCKRLSEIKASSVADGSQNKKNEAITRWYPGHTYKYTFNLVKGAIKSMKASVVDWIKINAETQNISLED
ncbi:MAG: fimbrillin family protein [Prevotella sp.]|nr:fimbrillin family protein [Prevotella sp.]